MMRIAFILWAALCLPVTALAAALAAVDQSGGYSDQVLEKVARHWNPPQENAERKVRVRVGLDGEGKVVRCEPVASSSSAAVDKAACLAVREAGSFGTPPYGLPIDVYLAFWTAKPTPMGIPAPPEAKVESAEATYAATVNARVRTMINLPAKMADGKYTVRAEARIDPDGRISQSRLTRRSGNADVDNAVMRALSHAGKMPPPPSKSTQDVNLTFIFQKP